MVDKEIIVRCEKCYDLIQSVGNNHEECVRKIIKINPEQVNLKYEGDMSILCLAIFKRNIEIIQTLLDYGADPQTQSIFIKNEGEILFEMNSIDHADFLYNVSTSHEIKKKYLKIVNILKEHNIPTIKEPYEE